MCYQRKNKLPKECYNEVVLLYCLEKYKNKQYQLLTGPLKKKKNLKTLKINEKIPFTKKKNLKPLSKK